MEKGTNQTVKFQGSGSSVPTEFTVLCDGFHAPLNHQKVTYKPEWGRQYKVVNGGGVENTTPLFKETECWPEFICGKNNIPKPSTTKKPEPTNPVSNDCFAKALGYECCNDNEIVFTDESGNWGVKNGQWCGIGGSSSSEPTPEPEPAETCGAYPCCEECNSVYTDADGDWGVENGDWCLLKKSCKAEEETWTGMNDGYAKCSGCDVSYSDDSGNWGVENGEWCGISSKC
uniref:Endo-glucanase CelJ n=1 Tax=Orpinomyces sp. (strain PC-2) TaxID=50059 RepID=Q96V95_ORPSP|nr:endo-glucanase CelJ [Orpinomyces sp. PC-2]